MQKRATTIEEQLNLLESRGLNIHDRAKAGENLLDIGYYRLGFYLFPLEETYPSLTDRTHQYIKGASFEDAINLYYFDFDLRIILTRYLNRIEVALRTALIYHLSNKYKDNPIWFVSPSIVERNYAADFGKVIYTPDFRRNPVIARHHQRHPNDRFAPAWKTLEFMTFGSILKLYESLRTKSDKIEIAKTFGIRQVVTFENYMHTIRSLRNACAHGQLLYGLKLSRRIRRGPARYIEKNSANISGALDVVEYIMGKISQNRVLEMRESILALSDKLLQDSPIFIGKIIRFS